MASVKKRPNGMYRARYRDADGQEHAKHFAREGDAQKWLDGITAARVTGTYVDPREARTTLETFYVEWSDRQVWAANTQKAMDLAVRSCTFAGVEFGKLKRSHVEQWVKHQVKAGLAPSTIRTRFNNVHGVLRGALLDRMLGADPMLGVTLPRQRRAEHAMALPTPEAVGAILRASDPWMATYVSLCAFAGLRLGEASAVQVSDFDFLRRTLHVQRQVQRAGAGQIDITPPKYGSERVVYLPDELVTMVSRHLVDVGVHGEQEWLFVGDHGNPPHQNTVGYWWRKTIAAAGHPGIRLHDLRHFYASGLIAAGCDVVTVQRALGHASATTTLNTYSHLWPTAEDRTRLAAAGIMRASVDRFADSAADQEALSPVI